MKVDPRQLRVAEAVRLLNSSPLGEVVQPHVVYRHLNRAAYKIGDGKKIDLLRYAAWLFHARHETFESGWTENDYEAHKDAVGTRLQRDPMVEHCHCPPGPSLTFKQAGAPSPNRNEAARDCGPRQLRGSGAMLPK